MPPIVEFCDQSGHTHFYITLILPILSAPTESTPENSPKKIWPLNTLPVEKKLNFPPLRSILLNLVHTGRNVEQLIFPGVFLNFTPKSFDILVF